MHGIRVFFQAFDGLLFGAMILLTGVGLATMYSYHGDNAYFNRQLIWVGLAVLAFVLVLIPDYRFFKVGNTTFFAYLTIITSLILVLFIGEITM